MHHFQWCSVPGQRAQTGTSEYVFHVLNLAWLVIIAINNNRKVPLPGSENTNQENLTREGTTDTLKGLLTGVTTPVL